MHDRSDCVYVDHGREPCQKRLDRTGCRLAAADSCDGPKEQRELKDGGTHWRHLANNIELSETAAILALLSLLTPKIFTARVLTTIEV